MRYTEKEKQGMPLLGLCPIGKFVFSHEDAKIQKKKLEEKLNAWNVPYVNIDEAVADGLVRGTKDIAPAVACLKSKNVKAVFMPHCNFGTEHAVGLIGRELGVPVLIWGPRDEAPLENGTRPRDTLCGLFASTKVLHKLNVPFSYIENCRTDDPALEKGVDTFLRGVNASACLRTGMKIGMIGQRIDFFWTTIVNESELLERFNVEVLPLDMVHYIRDSKKLAEKNRKAYAAELAELKKTVTVEAFESDDPMINVLASRDRMIDLAKENGLDAIALQSFPAVCEELEAYGSYATSGAGERFPVAGETDLHGAISCLMLQKAAFDAAPTYLSEYTVRHPQDDNAVLIWHAGAPMSMKHPDCRARIGKHWILPSPLSGMTHFKLKDGHLTFARFDGDHGDYQLAIGEGDAVPGPNTLNDYLWARVNNWPAWERTLMTGPFIHHTGMIYGAYGDALKESLAFIPGGVKPVMLGKDPA